MIVITIMILMIRNTIMIVKFWNEILLDIVASDPLNAASTGMLALGFPYLRLSKGLKLVIKYFCNNVKNSFFGSEIYSAMLRPPARIQASMKATIGRDERGR